MSLVDVADKVGNIVDGLRKVKSSVENPVGIRKLEDAANKFQKELDKTKAIMADIEKDPYKPVKSYELASSNSL